MAYNHVRRIAADAKVPVLPPQALRRTQATLAEDAGETALAVVRHLGHATAAAPAVTHRSYVGRDTVRNAAVKRGLAALRVVVATETQKQLQKQIALSENAGQLIFSRRIPTAVSKSCRGNSTPAGSARRSVGLRSGSHDGAVPRYRDLMRSCTRRVAPPTVASRWTNSAESELTALRHVKALVQVLGQRPSQNAFRRSAVIVVETQQRLRGDGDLEVDQLLAVILRAARRLVFLDRAEHLGERCDPTERTAA